jgi:hypothetical protein
VNDSAGQTSGPSFYNSIIPAYAPSACSLTYCGQHTAFAPPDSQLTAWKHNEYHTSTTTLTTYGYLVKRSRSYCSWLRLLNRFVGHSAALSCTFRGDDTCMEVLVMKSTPASASATRPSPHFTFVLPLPVALETSICQNSLGSTRIPQLRTACSRNS